MSNIPPTAPLAANPLTRAVLEIDEYASGLGWDQPARLFALVDTAQLRAQEPGLAAQLGLGDEHDDRRPHPHRAGRAARRQAAGRVPRHHRLARRGRRLRADRGAADAAAVRRGLRPGGAGRRRSWRSGSPSTRTARRSG